MNGTLHRDLFELGRFLTNGVWLLWFIFTHRSRLLGAAMNTEFTGKLVIAISSRALFNLDEGHKIFESQGVNAYHQYQVEREDELLEPGVAFPLVNKLLALNDKKNDHPLVEVILLSRNSADTGLRIFNSIEHYQLDISYSD